MRGNRGVEECRLHAGQIAALMADPDAARVLAPFVADAEKRRAKPASPFFDVAVHEKFQPIVERIIERCQPCPTAS